MAVCNFRLGASAKLYHNTGTSAAPVWVEISHVQDLTLGLKKEDIEANTKSSGGWETTIAGIKKAQVTFKMLKVSGDSSLKLLMDIYLDVTDPTELAIMDQDITTSGAEGLVATMDVFDLSDDHPVKGTITRDVTLRPTCNDVNPRWHITA